MIACALAALAAGVWYAWSTLRGGTSAVGQSAGALVGMSLPDPEGKEQALAQWTGKVLVVNFWATWCAPCREEMPMFMRFQQELGSKGVQFVGIAVDQPDKVKQFSQELQLNYPALIGGYGAMELSKTLGNTVMALPFTVVVDREGRVAHTQLGMLKEAQLSGILNKLL
ncbi:MAG TPA: TlpA disulfide reductase family protein [Casimicrobiaceae bacterium]|nr:TlpA disulfide reductase family protein [Casimicrobiaceae bacterium]